MRSTRVDAVDAVFSQTRKQYFYGLLINYFYDADVKYSLKNGGGGWSKFVFWDKYKTCTDEVVFYMGSG